jgi:hypothetical protein
MAGLLTTVAATAEIVVTGTASDGCRATAQAASED